MGRVGQHQSLWGADDQLVTSGHYATIDELRQAVTEFTRMYKTEWLIERHGHRTPREARTAAMASPQAA